MNTKQKIKIATIVSFLIIVFPTPHVVGINLILLGIIFLQPFFFIGVDPLDMHAIQAILLSGSSLLSLILIFKKSRLLTLACVFIQYLWLVYSLNKDYFNNIYYLSTMGLYLILSVILIIYLIRNKK